jgi:hypothetical protein
MQETQAEIQKLFAAQNEFQQAENTGFVWLYLQKPRATSAK